LHPFGQRGKAATALEFFSKPLQKRCVLTKCGFPKSYGGALTPVKGFQRAKPLVIFFPPFLLLQKEMGLAAFIVFWWKRPHRRRRNEARSFTKAKLLLQISFKQTFSFCPVQTGPYFFARPKKYGKEKAPGVPPGAPCQGGRTASILRKL